MLLWLPSGGRGSLPFYPWPQDLFAVGGAGMSSRSTAWWWELPQAGVWPVVLLEIGFPSSSLIVVVQLGPVVLWESCCSHLLVVNCFFFPVVAVSRAGEKHLKEASFHLGWIWLVQAHFQFLLGQEITFWQPDCWELWLWLWSLCTSCALVMVHFHFSPSAGHRQVLDSFLSFSTKETESWEPQCCLFPAGILSDH